MKLEYVASGTSFMCLGKPAISKDPQLVNLINNIFTDFFGSQPNHTFSILYNAWAESSYGERLSKFKPSIHNLHADSGGLQMVTLAHKLKPGTNMNDLREEVYNNQAEWADVGMSFDEIPVVVLPNIKKVFDKKLNKEVEKDKGSDRNDTRFRYFDRKNRQKYAKQTAENIKRQIEVFKAKNSTCKPFMICQGGDLETYLEWINTILETVPKEDHKNIAGVAMGGAALGTGPLEDIQKAFFASQVPVRDENGKLNLHVLGVGSASRMIPYLIFLQNGLYGNVHVSYDSTTHSRAVDTGMYYMLGEIVNGVYVEGKPKTLNFTRATTNEDVLPGEKPKNREPDLNYKIMLEDVKKYYPLDLSIDRFHEILNVPSVPYLEKYGSLVDWYEVRTAFCCASIKNFMFTIEKLLHDKDALLKLADSKYPTGAAEQLFDVKDIDTFNAWLNKWSPLFEQKKLSRRIVHSYEQTAVGKKYKKEVDLTSLIK
jgi:hypothetical protein